MIRTSNRRPRPYLLDTTLRDGEQAPGVSFSPEEKLQLVRRIDGVGVGEIEAGTAAMGDELIRTVSQMVRMDLQARLSLWCRARMEDLDAAAQCQVGAVHFSFPVSEIGLGVIDKDRRWVLRELCRLVKAARERFGYVSIGAQDASRADETFLEALAISVRELGVDRLRLADTVGIWTPEATARVIGHLRPMLPEMELGFHGHNDLGLATANALAALQAGADCVDVTVNGLGERAGNAALEQVAMASRLAAGIETGLCSDDLTVLCRHVAGLTGRAIPTNQPICGEGVFRHESGIHVRAMLKDPRAYEAFAPESVGQQGRELVAGTHSGRSGLLQALEGEGIDLTASQTCGLLKDVRRMARTKRRNLTHSELVELARKNGRSPQ
jgi:homocitrate synthase NifV